MNTLTVRQLQDIVSRAHVVIQTSDGADEHAELLAELKAVENLCTFVIGTSHMGVAADEPVLSTGTPAPSVNLQTVVAALAKRGITATVEYPGFLQVSAGAGRDWNIGTANPTWGADLVSGLGDVMQSANLGIPSTSTDVERIADKIQELVR